MSYKQRIKQLEELHRSLNEQVDALEKNHPHVEVQRLSELKKKKLQCRDEIARLTKLQWEEDTQRIGYGDE